MKIIKFFPFMHLLEMVSLKNDGRVVTDYDQFHAVSFSKHYIINELESEIETHKIVIEIGAISDADIKRSEEAISILQKEIEIVKKWDYIDMAKFCKAINIMFNAGDIPAYIQTAFLEVVKG
jgi:hypothetical protein